jgi:hypothetical protein
MVLVGVVLVILAILGLTGGGSEEGGGRKQASEPKQKPSKKEKRKKEKPAVTEVRLRAVPAEATYMCVDRGPGEEPVYVGTTSEPQTFKGKRVRINAGRASVRLSVNGEHVDVPESANPIGYDFQLRDGKVVTHTLPLGERPCPS